MPAVSWYTGDPVYDSILAAALVMPPLTVMVSHFVSAPYGRFGDAWPWLPKLNGRWGWMLMELPATLVFWPFFWSGPRASWTVPTIIAVIWGAHYLNRGFVFPMLMRVPRDSRTFSAGVVGTGVVVTALHGYLHGAFISNYGDHLTDAWLHDARFWAGIGLYLTGMALNLHSDAVLRSLRTREEVERGEKVYRMPRRGGFIFVTNPQYLGELMAWVGFAMVTWSLAGVFILAISAANLVPRAIATHRWYHERFPDYPRARKILVPFVF